MRDDIQVTGTGSENSSIQLAVLGYYGDSTMKFLTPAEARDLAKQLNDMADAQDAAYGVRPGPACTCVRASDTGHDTDCPRAAFARNAPAGSAHGAPDFRDE